MNEKHHIFELQVNNFSESSIQILTTTAVYDLKVSYIFEINYEIA